jgi:hypothetical protein
MVATLVLGVVVGAQAAAAPAVQEPERPAGELRVVLAAPVYEPDGAVSVETTTLPNAAMTLSYVYGRRSMCDRATSSSAEPKDAGFGWRLMANTISHTATELVVSIDWRRMWDRGQRTTNGPAGTVQLTLHPGDRIPLDHIPNTVSADACRAVGMGLEVRLARTAQPAPSPAPQSGGSRGPVLPLGATAGSTGVLNAELWLVHKRPSGSEEVLHQNVRFDEQGGTFSFSTVKIQTTRGEVGFEMAGSIQRYRMPAGGPNGSEFVVVDLTRVVTGGTAPPGGFRSATGPTVMVVDPNDVVSFEMPRAGGRGGGAAIGAVGVPRVGGARGGGGGGVAGAGARSGGGRGGVVVTGAPGEVQRRLAPVSEAVQALALLEGNMFSLRVRLAAQ